jgi:hypothetical protein
MADLGIVMERGVPIPKRKGGRRESAYPLRTMAPGDSFLVPGGERVRNTLLVLAKRYGIKITTRIEHPEDLGKKDALVRVWRLA